jgi:amino acid transporter
MPHGEGLHLDRVLRFSDLLVYGLVYVAPIGPWSTWAFTSDLAGGAVALAYLLGAAALSFTALSYSRMAMEASDAGSVYSYARRSMGEGIGFLSGWMVLLDYLLFPALMYVFCGATLAEFMPFLPAWGWILITAGYNIAVNWFGIKASARFNLGTLVFQFLLLFSFLLLGACVLTNGGGGFTATPWWGPKSTPAGVFSAASLCVMAYLGFDAITTLSAEVRPDQRHLIGRAVILSLSLLGALAVVDVWVLSDLARGLKFADPTTATFETIGARIHPTFGTVTAWATALVVAISVTPPMVTGVSRVLYAMALNHEMPPVLARLHRRYRVPHMALLASGALSILVALYFARQFDTLTSMVNFGALSAFVAVNASVIALFGVRRRSGRWLADIVLPGLGIAALLAVTVQMSRLALVVGLGWMAAGIVTYQLLSRRRRKP